jgi:hypothetical protein
MLKRRADYGTSEALLYSLHEEKKKVFQLPPLAAAMFLALCIAILLFSVVPLLPAGVCFIVEALTKMGRIGRLNASLSPWKILFSTVRSHFSFCYFVSFHLIRYYLLLFLLLGILFHTVLYVCLFMLIVASSVDYSLKRPSLSFPLFLFYYVLEHISYQLGVFAGCLRRKTFGSYSARVVRKLVGFP